MRLSKQSQGIAPAKNGRRTCQTSGFSLIETMIVLAMMMIASGIFFMSLQPALKDTRVTNAYNTTLMTHAPGAGSGHRGTPHLHCHLQQRGHAELDHHDASRHRPGDHNPDSASLTLSSG